MDPNITPQPQFPQQPQAVNPPVDYIQSQPQPEQYPQQAMPQQQPNQQLNYPQNNYPINQMPTQAQPVFMGNNNGGGSGKKKLVIIIAAAVFLLVAIGAGLWFLLSNSSVSIGRLDTGTVGSISYKKPADWKQSENTKDSKTFTPEGKSKTESNALLIVNSKTSSSKQELSEANKTKLKDLLLKKLTAEELTKSLSTDKCENIQDAVLDHANDYPNALLALNFSASCATKSDNVRKHLSSMVVVFNNGSLANINVAVLADDFESNKASIKEILYSVKEQ